MTEGINSLVLGQNLQNAQSFVRISVASMFGLAFLLYGLVLHWRSLENPKADRVLWLARIFYIIGTGCVFSYLTLALISPNEPLALVVNVGIALILALFPLFLDRGQAGMPAFNFLSGALVWLFTMVGPFVLSSATNAPRPPSTWLTYLHVFLAIAGEGLCIVAFCASLLYLWDYRNLKSKWIQKIPMLPSLDSLDRLIQKASIIGLFLITISLVTGVAIVIMGNGLAGVTYTKIIWAFAVWGWYILCIFGREVWGWRGRRGALLSTWGTFLLLLALFGTVWTSVL